MTGIESRAVAPLGKCKPVFYTKLLALYAYFPQNYSIIPESRATTLRNYTITSPTYMKLYVITPNLAYKTLHSQSVPCT